MKGDAVLGRLVAAAAVGSNDGDPVWRDAEMAQDQRQNGLADTSAAQHDEPARQLSVNDMLGHRANSFHRQIISQQATGRDRVAPPGTLGHGWPVA